MKVTRKLLDARIEQLNKALGQPIKSSNNTTGKWQANIGNIHLDKDQSGYSILQMTNIGGGCRHFLNNYRMTAFETYLCLDSALFILEQANPAKALANSVLTWASESRPHGGNPHCFDFVKQAQVIKERH